MASQIAHIIYARKYLEKHPMANGSEDEFMLGCVFPDIRYIDEHVKRKDTHLFFAPVDLNFEGLTAFQAGWKFHLYCDMRREEILNSNGFYDLPETAKNNHAASKLLEDELVYGEYNNWEKIIYYFNNAPFFQCELSVEKETFQLWYAILGKYLEQAPTERTVKIFISKLLKSPEKALAIMETFDKLKKDARVVELLKDVKNEII